MPQDEVTLVSTSDSPAQVRAALKVPEPAAPAVTPPVVDPAAPKSTLAPVAAPVETKDGKEKDDSSPKTEERFAKLTRERYEAKARIEQLERELAAKAPPAAAPQGDGHPGAAPVTEAPGFDKPRPKQDDFDDFDKYQDALSDWMGEKAEFTANAKAEQRVGQILEEQRRQAWHADQQRQAQQQMANYYERAEATRQQFADYDEALQADHLKVHPDQIPAIRDFTFHEPNGPVIGYYLAKSPAEFDRIARLPYGAQLAELGRLDAKLGLGQLQVPAAGAGIVPASTPPPAAVVTQAAPVAAPVIVRPAVSAAPMPPPRMPSAGGGGATPVTLQALADSNDYQNFRAKRNQGVTH